MMTKYIGQAFIPQTYRIEAKDVEEAYRCLALLHAADLESRRVQFDPVKEYEYKLVELGPDDPGEAGERWANLVELQALLIANGFELFSRKDGRSDVWTGPNGEELKTPEVMELYNQERDISDNLRSG